MKPATTQPNCADCGRPVKAIETVPGSEMYHRPEFCQECLERQGAEQWRREEQRLRAARVTQ